MSNSQAYQNRVRQLVVDGYIVIQGNRLQLTAKGFAVLLAEADRPQIKGDLKGPSLLYERMRADARRAIQQSSEQRTSKP